MNIIQIFITYIDNFLIFKIILSPCLYWLHELADSDGDESKFWSNSKIKRHIYGRLIYDKVLFIYFKNNKKMFLTYKRYSTWMCKKNNEFNFYKSRKRNLIIKL